MTTDPLHTFQAWLDDAKRHGVHEPTAMALATVDRDNHPAVRMVLLKHADEKGFVFYTNTDSPKGEDLRHCPYASLCFYWNPPGRQVRVSGRVETVTDEEADAYFNSRPYLSRIGARTSKQSQPLSGYAELECAVAAEMLLHPRGRVPRPNNWSGYRVIPDTIELWQERSVFTNACTTPATATAGANRRCILKGTVALDDRLKPPACAGKRGVREGPVPPPARPR